MPIKRLVEEKQRKRNPFKHIPASFLSCSPLPFFFLCALNFTSIQATRYQDTIISPPVSCISPVFQCVLLFPPVLHSFCLCLTKTPRGVWSSCPICQSDTVVSTQNPSPTHPSPHTFTLLVPADAFHKSTHP